MSRELKKNIVIIYFLKSYVLCSAVCCPLNCLVCGTQSWLHVKSVGSEQVELVHRSAFNFLLFLSQTNHSVCFSLFSSLSSQVSVHTNDLHVFSGPVRFCPCWPPNTL